MYYRFYYIEGVGSHVTPFYLFENRYQDPSSTVTCTYRSEVNDYRYYQDGCKNIVASIEENSNEVFIIYPNPCSSIINFPQLTSETEIVNSTGELITTLESGATYYDISELEKGLYILKTNTSNYKFVKQ